MSSLYRWRWCVVYWPSRSRGCVGWAARSADAAPGLPAAPGHRSPWGCSAGHHLKTRDWPATSATSPGGSCRCRRLQDWLCFHPLWVLAPTGKLEENYSEKMKHMKLFESCKESCMNMCFFYTIKQSITVLRRAAGVLGWYLLQDPSAVTGHGKVSQERERQLLNSAVIGGDSWSELHHRVHQRVAKQRFRAHCRNRAAAAKSAASWKQNTEQNIGLRVRVQTQLP